MLRVTRDAHYLSCSRLKASVHEITPAEIHSGQCCPASYGGRPFAGFAAGGRGTEPARFAIRPRRVAHIRIRAGDSKRRAARQPRSNRRIAKEVFPPL